MAHTSILGRVAEWLKASPSKREGPGKGSVGSNPTPSSMPLSWCVMCRHTVNDKGSPVGASCHRPIHARIVDCIQCRPMPGLSQEQLTWIEDTFQLNVPYYKRFK